MLKQVEVDIRELTPEQLVKVIKSLLEYLDITVYVEHTPDYEEHYVRKEPEATNWKSEWPQYNTEE